jgi:deoxyribodipyrimidine photo-lyase
MSDLILFWHRRDLRISDNIGLAAARQESPKVVGIFCLDRNILNPDEVAPARVTYMIGCLQKLSSRYRESGSQLLIIQDDPSLGIPKLATAINAKAVFWNWDVEPYAKKRDQSVSNALQQAGIQVQNFWDQVLHAPDELRSGTGQPYTVYTPFWKKWNSKPKAKPVETLPITYPELMTGLTAEEQESANQAGAIETLPTALSLGFIWENPLVIEPGEDAALKKLEEFCDRAIYQYQGQRNFPAINGTSQLSAALKFGAIGIRTVWQATQIVMDTCRNEESVHKHPDLATGNSVAGILPTRHV